MNTPTPKRAARHAVFALLTAVLALGTYSCLFRESTLLTAQSPQGSVTLEIFERGRPPTKLPLVDRVFRFRATRAEGEVIRGVLYGADMLDGEYDFETYYSGHVWLTEKAFRLFVADARFLGTPIPVTVSNESERHVAYLTIRSGTNFILLVDVGPGETTTFAIPEYLPDYTWIKGEFEGGDTIPPQSILRPKGAQQVTITN